MKKSKMIVWTVFMGILAAVAFRGLSCTLVAKGAWNKNGDFYRVAGDCDVLFLGTSHVTTAVYPMELYDEYGITSYNLSGYGHPLPLSYWVFMNALDYAQPEVVVVDCYMMESNRAVMKDEKFMHDSFDNMPLSRTKVRAVYDLFDDFDSRMEYLWNFSLYHGRWDDLRQKDIEVEYGNTRGAIFEIGQDEPDAYALRDQEVELIDSVGVAYLRKIVEECQSRGINVVLTFLPFPAQEDQQRVAAYASEIAKEYGVPYLNFLGMDIIDFQTDLFDSYSHVNVAGGHKLTTFMGEYLRENYGVADRRQDGTVNWDEDYAAYQRYKIDRLQGQENLENYFVMMADKSLSICLFVDGKSRIWDYEQYVNQVKNLAPGHRFSALEKAARQGEDYFLLIDNKDGNVVDYCGKECGEMEMSFGRAIYERKENGARAFYIGDADESFLVERDEDGRTPTVQMVIINNLDGEIVDVQRFDESLRVVK